jgi:two-component system OmpR family sensor kinase
LKKDDDSITLRLTGSYLSVFLVIIVALSTVAYLLIAANYRDLLGPALGTAEGERGLHHALYTVIASIVAIDFGLVLFVGAASYALAHAAVLPLLTARRREERFTADVAHELRTPLGAIASIAQAAQMDETYERGKALEIITTRALEAGKLVGDLLTLARQGEARMLVSEPVDIAALVSSLVNDWAKQISAGGVTIRFRVRSAIIEGEEAHLRRLMQNLFENAVRYARSEVTITVDTEGRYARICVEDDGPGVEAVIQASLFERFIKGETSPGSGLGLSICRWTAQAHGGEIRFAGGSRFIVRLPLVRGVNGE